MFTILDIELAQQGDKIAYQRLIEINKVYLFNIAIAILNNTEDAADAISETILIAYKNLKSLRQPEFFRTWITRILINESRKILKKQRRIVSIEDYKETDISLEEDFLGQQIQGIDLKTAIEKLDTPLRSVILLYYYNDFSIKEIAQILKIPEGTVKTRMHRAKKCLYEILLQERRKK